MKPYGCHSKPRKDGYWARNRIYGEEPTQKPIDVLVLVPDVMSKECHYRTTTPDPRCQGCTCP